MASVFTERLCAAIRSCDGGEAPSRLLIGRAIADTLGVAAAGFVEPVARLALDAYRGDAARTWSAETCDSDKAAVMIDAIAAHALDFDDVFLDSAIHPSTVILPTILRNGSESDPSETVAAFGAGLIAAQAVAARIGLGHYHRGWHGTGTIGAFAAAAAAGRLRRLDEHQFATTFAIVASQSGGLKLNFGTMTKPAHAGFAAAAGYHAARLAQAGMSAAEDIFGPGGYADLYVAADGVEEPADDVYRLRPDRIALKLYPCCYATHRLIGIALEARAALGQSFANNPTRIRVTVPKGSTEVVKYDRPRTGLEAAKFSTPYTIAVAMLDGPPTLDHFLDRAVTRQDVRECMERITITEDPQQESGGDIKAGTATLEVLGEASNSLASFSRRTIPGAPNDPPSSQDVRAKIESCSRRFRPRLRRTVPCAAAGRRRTRSALLAARRKPGQFSSRRWRIVITGSAAEGTIRHAYDLPRRDPRRLSIAEAADVIARTYAALATGEVLPSSPSAMRIAPPPQRIQVKGAVLAHEGIAGARLSSARDPRLILWDLATAEPILLLEEGWLYTFRTGTSGAVVARWLSPCPHPRIGLVGAGAIATHMARGFVELCSPLSIRIAARTVGSAQRLVEAVDGKGVDIAAAPGTEEAVRDADIVATITTAKSPIVKPSWIRPQGYRI